MSPIIEKWNRYWFTPVTAARARWLFSMFMLLLAFDTWVLMLPHAGRYGAGAFNVAHFDFIDAIQTPPDASRYVVVTLLVGVLAFVSAIVGVHRGLLACLFALYTYSWSMSLIDSYQHHYLLSLCLFCFLFWPSNETINRRGATWPYVLLACSISIVYAFTAITKMDPDWQRGHALQQLAYEGLADVALTARNAGISNERFWNLLSLGIAVLQIVLCAGYLFAPMRDRSASRFVTTLCALAFIAAVLFHGGIELLSATTSSELDIGWFSFYMLAFAFVFFSPGPWLERAAKPFASIKSFSQSSENENDRPILWVMLGAALLISYFVFSRLDLPGSTTAGVILIGMALVWAVPETLRGIQSDKLRTWIGALLSATVMMWISITFTSVRFDYYRFVGGDFLRRGELEYALDAYEKAVRYASNVAEKKSKEEKVIQLRRILGR